MQVPSALRTLDHRRRWARWRAPVWFVLGAGVIGACAAAVGLAVLAVLARAYSFVTGTRLRDAPVWGWTGPTTLVLASVTVGLAVVATAAAGIAGSPRRLLAALRVRPVARGAAVDTDRFANVVEGLAIGLGVPVPHLWVIDDEAPNALSTRTWRRHHLVVTTGLLAFPRDELEAVCAHELAHLNAADARWTAAAETSLGRARRAGLLITTVAILVGYLCFKVELWSGVAFAAVLGGIGLAAAWGVGRVLPRLRAESDALADVAAIRLSRNPESLGDVCERLAADPRHVSRRVALAERSWFKLLPGDDEIDTRLPIDAATRAAIEAAAAPAHARAARELRSRSAAAYAEARVGAHPRPTPGPG